MAKTYRGSKYNILSIFLVTKIIAMIFYNDLRLSVKIKCPVLYIYIKRKIKWPTDTR